MRTFTLRALLAGLALTFALALSVRGANEGPAEVTADFLNFRDAPSTAGQILDAAPQGTVVLVLEESGGWCRVLWGGRTGYMSANYLSMREEAALELGPGVLTGDSVRFRTGPSLEASVSRYLYRGDAVSVIGAAGPWYRVQFDGSEGYLHSDYVALEAPAPAAEGELAQSILDLAQSYLGVPYQWGGTSPTEGFDCSGLVYYCFVNNGFSMYRTASTQYGQGEGVAREELRAGDLVFFASPSGWAISHVGLYLGDGSFIHASSGAGKVVVSQLSSWYYDTYYYGARRLLS